MEQKTAKQYGHIQHLITRIVTTSLENRTGMQGPAFLSYDDPMIHTKTKKKFTKDRSSIVVVVLLFNVPVSS
ncbi:MAG: hypothetical protein AB2693_11030 [Candidatus Thiodiazotropha sp.]